VLPLGGKLAILMLYYYLLIILLYIICPIIQTSRTSSVASTSVRIRVAYTLAVARREHSRPMKSTVFGVLFMDLFAVVFQRSRVLPNNILTSTS